MSYIELEGFGDSGTPLVINKRVVAACTSVEDLSFMFRRLDNEAVTMSEFLKAYREAEIDDDSYYERTAGKLAFHRIASKWVERRIIELGAEPPYLPNDPRARTIRVMQEKLDRLHQRVAQMEKSA